MSKRFEIVGSFLRPETLLNHKRTIETREDITYPFYNDLEGYKAAEDAAVADVIQKQKDADIAILTDGEFTRSLWHLDFLWGLEGVQRFIAQQGYVFRDHNQTDGFETRKDIGIKITSKLGGKNHHFIQVFKNLKAQAGDKQVKLTIPSPSHIYCEFFWATHVDLKAVYPDTATLKADLINAYIEFVDEFVAAGGTILQLDDCLWEIFAADNPVSPYAGKGVDSNLALAHEFIEINNAVIAHGKAKGLKVWTHNCRGNYKSRNMGDGSYDAISDLFLKSQNYDRFFLEWDDERAGTLDALKAFVGTKKEVVLGFLSSKTGELDDEKRVLEQLEAAAKILPKEQLFLSHQCGFASCDNGNELTEAQQWEKVAQGQKLALQFWGE